MPTKAFLRDLMPGEPEPGVDYNAKPEAPKEAPKWGEWKDYGKS